MSMQPYNNQVPHGGLSQELMVAGQPGKVDLQAWAYSASQVHKMAQALANTTFVPQALRGKPDDIAAQILYGADVNMPPMVALQQINVIDGKPSLSALSMRGLAQARMGVKFQIHESTETRCRMAAKAPGDPGWTEVLWTMDRAKKLGVATKQNWQKQPQAMLIARATSELCRLVAAPMFLGLAYSTEELSDGDMVAAEPAPEPVRKTRTVRREPPPEPEPEQQEPVKVTASFDNGPSPERILNQPTELKADAVTANTRKALMARFNDAGITERVPRLAYVSDLLNREVGSVNDISEAEARSVLDQLKVDFP